jgi:hypothetical protein
MTVPAKKEDNATSWGIYAADHVAAWARNARKTTRRMGHKLGIRLLGHIESVWLEHQLLLSPNNGIVFVVGTPSEAIAARVFVPGKNC